MSELLEFILEFLGDLVMCLLDAWLGTFEWPDTLVGRLILGGLIVVLVFVIWCEVS